MATNVSICNMALNLLGHNSIAAMDQGTETARKCNLFLQPAIDATIRAYNWNCATEMASLARVSGAPAFRFDYQYALPNDCLRVIQMAELDYVFKIQGRYLLTNESTAKILYLKRIGVGEMDPLLIQAVAARLAADLAFPLTNSASLQEAMVKLFMLKIQEAQEIDAQEGTPDDVEVDDWLEARI